MGLILVGAVLIENLIRKVSTRQRGFVAASD